ncbi:MAG: OsmC family protein [Pseudonocardia sp.]|uniref:OsmC family protein n=1 Tax=unclassified Pseudonocardia TaxID=2619320 RepID=UPI00086830A9|nr:MULTISPECIES: OsmC family protein [unclassified Pseudonocardia]MBN9107848.1 OsmC family protein [Pseudonocardia sp.]ODV07457.1 MAG: osmotically inducible protein OsmC [Pseudonocardia sp. SCN 73-27]
MSVETDVSAAERDEIVRRTLGAAAAKFTEHPERASATFRTSGVGGSGMRTDIRVGAHTVVIDEPAGLGGADAAPSPVEMVLAALLACQVVTYRVWAAKLGIPLDDVSVDVEGDLDRRGFFGVDHAVRAGFTDVRVVVTLSGPAGEERYQELAAAVDAHCPVLDTFQSPIPVTVEHRVAPQAG